MGLEGAGRDVSRRKVGPGQLNASCLSWSRLQICQDTNPYSNAKAGILKQGVGVQKRVRCHSTYGGEVGPPSSGPWW